MNNNLAVVILRKLADNLLLNDYQETHSPDYSQAIVQRITINASDNCGATGECVIHIRNGKIQIVGGFASVLPEKTRLEVA